MKISRLKILARVPLLVIAGLACTASAYADSIYTLTLTPNASSSGKISGTVTLDLSTPIPVSGSFDALQNGSITATTTKLLGLNVLLSNGVTYSFSQENSTADVTFFNGSLSNINYTDNGVSTNLIAIQGQGYQYSTNGNYSGTAFTQGTISLTPKLVTATPEPSSLILLGTGLLGAIGVVRRRVADKTAARFNSSPAALDGPCF